MRWQNNEHSDVATANTSGSCRLARDDQTSVLSVRARTSVERKRSEAAEAEEEDEVVPVIKSVLLRGGKQRPQPSLAEVESDSVGVEVTRLDHQEEELTRHPAQWKLISHNRKEDA